MVSEFDMNFPNDRLQADYTRDFLTAWFAHPATEAFIMWGFWGRAHWMGERGAMFKNDWTPKPNLAAYEQLVLRDWWTDTTTSTDSQGTAKVRAFHGRHRLEISAPGVPPFVREFELRADGVHFEIVFTP